MDMVQTFLDAVASAVQDVVTTVAGFLPNLLKIIVILIVGWVIAKFLEWLVVKVLKVVRLDTFSEKFQVASFMAKGGIKATLSELIGVLIYWVVILITFVAVINVLQLEAVAGLLSQVVNYIPNVIVSIFILVLGIYLATLVSTIVRAAAASAGLTAANGLARFSQIVILIFAIITALSQLKIAAQIVQPLIIIILGSLGLGVAIAIGLGCKELAGKYVGDLIEQLKKRS